MSEYENLRRLVRPYLDTEYDSDFKLMAHALLAALDRIKSLEALLQAYRLGGHPGEKALDLATESADQLAALDKEAGQ